MSVHILMYPYPTAGHIIPLLDLAHKLLHLPRPAAPAVAAPITVTVIVTPDNLHLVNPFPASSSSLQPLVLPSLEPPRRTTPAAGVPRRQRPRPLRAPQLTHCTLRQNS
ncbi:hypothetical protein ACJRO7_009848 [Eucalyptus globulus]|uniref:Uncharacterized protein n=1 Tax=Eucalyptus globulus TaxID=34317 RepID=A0ABD3LA44_EUCGL